MTCNPLTAPIAQILRNTPDGLSEYELLRQLAFDGLNWDQTPDCTPDLLLFRKHFLIMNALYSLQPVLWEEGYYLSISALKIELQTTSTNTNETLPSQPGDQAIREYYLDWGQFEQSSNESVDRLLNDFWQRYFSDDKTQDALTVLHLEAECSWSEIRNAYRRLAAKHHPDRGGDSEQFILIREAYELLACRRESRELATS